MTEQWCASVWLTLCLWYFITNNKIKAVFIERTLSAQGQITNEGGANNKKCEGKLKT